MLRGSAGTKGKSDQVHLVSVGAGHDRSSARIAATRREPSRDTGWGRAGGTAAQRERSAR